MTLYYIENGSTYLEIVRIKYYGAKYIKTHINWYTRPGMKLIHTEKNLKINREIFKRTQVLKNEIVSFK